MHTRPPTARITHHREITYTPCCCKVFCAVRVSYFSTSAVDNFNLNLPFAVRPLCCVSVAWCEADAFERSGTKRNGTGQGSERQGNVCCAAVSFLPSFLPVRLPCFVSCTFRLFAYTCRVHAVQNRANNNEKRNQKSRWGPFGRARKNAK